MKAGRPDRGERFTSRCIVVRWTRSFKLGEQRYDLEHHPRATREIRDAASNADLTTKFWYQNHFGNPELPLFQRSGKETLFTAALNCPRSSSGYGKSHVNQGARIAMSSSTTSKLNLWLNNGRVSFSPVASAQNLSLDLHKYLVFPGLINAHDHLELNLFPKLGCGPYANASAWAKDIYRPHEPPVKQHLKVPKRLRLRWGGIKNLISGATTVAHHNAFQPVFLEPSFPVRVVKRYGWAHSIRFSPDWRMRLQSTPADYPFVIHAAEGTDEAARREVQILAKAGALNRSTVLVHGVGITCSDVPLLKGANTSLVWCPTSNHFTLNRSLDTGVLNSGIPVALGSDSAMTADGDLLDELRVAHRRVDAHRLYTMVTSEPARMLKLPVGFGQICQRWPSRLVSHARRGQTPAVTLLESYPELVIIGGRMQLVSSDFARLCPASILNSLQPFEVEGQRSIPALGRYLISAERNDRALRTRLVSQERPLPRDPADSLTSRADPLPSRAL